MRNKEFKAAQHELNKLVREVNRSIEKDDLWNGRYYITQASGEWSPFDDGSGGMLYVTLVCVDKKDGTLLPMFWDYLPGFVGNRWKLFVFMNDFIVKYTDTWQNGNDPYKEKGKIDYTKWPRIDFKFSDLKDINCWYSVR